MATVNSPYRCAIEPLAEADRSPPAPIPSWDMAAVFALLWIVSVARVWTAFAGAEPAGAEVTLAGLCALLLPILIIKEIAARRASRG